MPGACHQYEAVFWLAMDRSDKRTAHAAAKNDRAFLYLSKRDAISILSPGIPAAWLAYRNNPNALLPKKLVALAVAMARKLSNRRGR